MVTVARLLRRRYRVLAYRGRCRSAVDAVAPADHRIRLHADRAGGVDTGDRQQFGGPGDADRRRQRRGGRRRRRARSEVAGQQRHGVADRHHLAEQGLTQRRRRHRLGGKVRAAHRHRPGAVHRHRRHDHGGVLAQARRWTRSRRQAARCRPGCPPAPARPPRRWYANRSATPRPTPEYQGLQWLPDATGPRRGESPEPRCSSVRSVAGGSAADPPRLRSASSHAPGLRRPSRDIDRRRCGPDARRIARRRRALLSWFVVPHLRMRRQEAPGADRERDVNDVGEDDHQDGDVAVEESTPPPGSRAPPAAARPCSATPRRCGSCASGAC